MATGDWSAGGDGQQTLDRDRRGAAEGDATEG
jgi:hypothetical protein